MAWIKLQVEDLKEAELAEPEYIEIEGIWYQDTSGNIKKYKLKALMPITTAYIQTKCPDYDWDIDYNHVVLIKGDKIK